MKCFIELLISFALCFTYAELKRIDLNDFVQKLAKYDDFILSKKVFIEAKKMSLNDYFKLSNPTLIVVEDNWPITTQNMFEVSHFLNTVTSCTYCENLYYDLSSINRNIDQCISVRGSSKRSNSLFDRIIDCYKSKVVERSMKIRLDKLSNMVSNINTSTKIYKR